MNGNTRETFFYGLFMDAAILHDLGVRPSSARRAVLEDFELRIGQRATLVPSPGSKVFGMLMVLSQTDLDSLYTAPGLEGYQPETISSQPLDGGDAVAAVCYNLKHAPDPQERNPDYATRLRTVLTKLGFPADYIEAVS